MDSVSPGRDPFMPKPPKVRGRALALALFAHVLLILGLAFGVNWRSDEPATVSAELWSATPQAAAPRAVEPAPTAPPEPKPAEPAPAPKPPPEPAVAPKPALPDPQIAIEKAKREDAKRLAAEQEQQKKLKREQAEREREELAAKREKEKEKADRLKAEQAKTEQAKNEKAEKAEAARLAAVRDANLKRMAGLAGATGGPADTGTAQRSSAPSAGYAGRVAARVKPNIVFTDSIDGNPTAVVQVKLAPDGTIIAKRLVQSSGVKVWDDAVLRAIERTEMLPLDNGRAPPQFEIGFRPRD
jgi:colicin import membrane protein